MLFPMIWGAIFILLFIYFPSPVLFSGNISWKSSLPVLLYHAILVSPAYLCPHWGSLNQHIWSPNVRQLSDLSSGSASRLRTLLSLTLTRNPVPQWVVGTRECSSNCFGTRDLRSRLWSAGFPCTPEWTCRPSSPSVLMAVLCVTSLSLCFFVFF